MGYSGGEWDKMAYLFPQLFPRMAKVMFFLKDPKSDKPTSIRLQFQCADGRFKYYTGEVARPADWDASNQTTANKGTKAHLNRLSSAVEQLVLESKLKGEQITKEILRTRLNLVRKKEEYIETDNLFSAMRVEVGKMETGLRLTPKKKRYSPGSIKTYNFTIGLLEQFNPRMTMASITMDTYHRFIKWCHDKDYATNYIGSQIKNWKALCKMIGGNDVFDRGSFKKISEDAVDVYLDEQEIARIASADVSKYLAVYRDWFIIDCYTGLRVSDIKLLSKKNISSGFITIANEKTDEKVVIPIHPLVKEILQRYKGLPPAVLEQDMNEHIKTIAEKAGIDNDVLHTITKGGKRQDSYRKKWEMITNHTARRSFITNLRKNGVPDSIVMKLTGIKSSQTLKRYDKLSPDEAAKIAANLQFFK